MINNGSANGHVTRRENLSYIEIRVILLKNATTGLYKLCINWRFPVRSYNVPIAQGLVYDLNVYKTHGY